MRFTLTGFRQETEFRVFAFDGIAEDRTRTEFTVRTDLALSRKYGIRMQELPLLCRGLLDRREDGQQECSFTFTEDEMRKHFDIRAAAEREAAQKRFARKPPPPGV